MKIISVVGARPNFMKIAPFIKAIANHNSKTNTKIEHILVHTGQHYDDRMSRTFFEELNIPDADINLGIGSGSHAEQVGNTMIAFEKVLLEETPDWVIVVGDVNATLACSVTAKKLNISVCHIEAGLRSGDETMPEEINRLVTDRLSDLLLTPDTMSSENLRKEGVPEYKIEFVGNIMIDTLENNRDKAYQLSISEILNKNVINEISSFEATNFENNDFGLITMHRPSNVDDPKILTNLIDWMIDYAAEKVPLIWPIHPRTLKRIEEFGLLDKIKNCDNLFLTYPLSYFELLRLNMQAKIMLTDSGGLQEECCVLGTPFLTLRWNTERPITLVENGGAGYIVGNNISRIEKEFNQIIQEKRKPNRPELWDGNTANRCLKAILNYKTVK